MRLHATFRGAHENLDLLHALLHLVERADLRHAGLDRALWRDSSGEDEFGNRYFRTKGGKIDPALGFERRWVIYNGYTEASMIGPAWHGWMHHTVDVPPTQENYVARAWQKPHRPNPTGTPAAQRPTGSTLAQGRRAEGDPATTRLGCREAAPEGATWKRRLERLWNRPARARTGSPFARRIVRVNQPLPGSALSWR